VRQLLNFADQHYETLLREIQGDVSCLNHIDQILANAALMVLYGLANHCVRIRISQIARLHKKQLPVDVLPNGTQWIFLIRAAHSAYVGLRHNARYAFSAASPNSNGSTTSYPSIDKFNFPDLHGSHRFSPEDGPSILTRRMFYPIVAATQALAFKKLRVRFQAVASAETSCISSDLHLRTCFHVLETLNNIAVAVFCDESAKPKYYEQTSLGRTWIWLGPFPRSRHG